VQQLHRGRAIFSQPPMPIKCAGAPQKAMYLSADHWRRQGVLGAIDIQFCNAGAGAVRRARLRARADGIRQAYGIHLNFGQTLVSVDGPARKAVFSQAQPDGSKTLVTREFDMLHAVPPQKAPDFIRISPLADAAGWIDVDPATLRHKRFSQRLRPGRRHQHPQCQDRRCGAQAGAGGGAQPAGRPGQCRRQGRGPLRRLRLLPADGGARQDRAGRVRLRRQAGPQLPTWLIDGTRPSALAWYLKERILPPLYWDGMLKGREWLAQPEMVG
jgi:sulfide:quinone oxidoreductase